MFKHKLERGFFLLTGILASILSFAKIGVGIDFQDDCGGFQDIPLYLYVSGGIEIALNILTTTLAIAFPKKGSKRHVIPNNLYLLIILGLNIWGSYIVFSKFILCLTKLSLHSNWWSFHFVIILGAYGIWQNESPEDENYCASAPFLLAFILLILSWVSLFLLLTGGMIVGFIFGCCFYDEIIDEENLDIKSDDKPDGVLKYIDELMMQCNL